MVSTTTAYLDTRNRAVTGEGLDGVVRIAYNNVYGTGALLFDGRAILTVAHLFAGDLTQTASIRFETNAGTYTGYSSQFLIHPAYDKENANHDLALIWLDEAAPVLADRYQPYRDSDEIGQTFWMIGYGTPGTGASGKDANYTQSLRLKAKNVFDTEASFLKENLGNEMAWAPAEGAILAADFDNGLSAQDALGWLVGVNDVGLGDAEGLIAPGDSGGPAFVDGQLAGVASYTAALSSVDATPDIDASSNSSFGEVGFWHRVSEYQQWIDESIRLAYPDVPQSREGVSFSVTEGDSGTSYVYFLLEFQGMRAEASDWISVSYATRDGTAQHGSDYVPSSGKLIIYPTQTQAVIAVEIIPDGQIESDEEFYLDVFNPVGGGFPGGVLTLSAVRTIIDNDGL